MMHCNEAGLAIIKEREGLKLTAYKCQAGVWTIGYGHTHGIKRGMTCTKDQAEQWLREDVAWAEQAVDECVQVPINNNQFSALVSWTFNLGSSALKYSTLLRLINTEKFYRVPDEMKKWNKVRNKKTGKKEVSNGLVTRRQMEGVLFATVPFVEKALR